MCLDAAESPVERADAGRHQHGRGNQSAITIDRNAQRWRASCGEIGTAGRLPGRVSGLLGVARSLCGPQIALRLECVRMEDELDGTGFVRFHSDKFEHLPQVVVRIDADGPKILVECAFVVIARAGVAH